MNGGDLNQQQQQQMLLQQQQWAAMQQYQQHWMAMQYPAAVMQPQPMMYNQHYVPYYHHQQQQQDHYQHQPQSQAPRQHNQIQSAGEDNKTIWIGDLLPWMDESYLHSCFSRTGEVVSIKIIRNRHTGQSERYGFVEFNSSLAADNALQGYNGTTMPNAEQPFRLNWAAFSSNDRRPEPGSDSSIFVGDLAMDVTDAILLDTFASRYSSVKGAKVVVDSSTGRSKGYGFVRFGDENDKSRALTEMNGELCSSRPMRISVATPRKPLPQQQFSSQGQLENESSNTTIFVGGLDSDVTDEELRDSFIASGEVVSVKIPAGKGCGFVQFADRSSAEDAIQRLNGTVIGKQTVRLSWGRSPANKQNQWNGGHYGRQNYNGYGHSGAAYRASSNGNINHQQQPIS